MGNHLTQLDLASAAQYEYDFLRLIDKYPALHSNPVLHNAMVRYETYWLPLASQHNECLPAPLDIEWLWHCHILNPLKYVDDCEKHFNVVIDHQPMLMCESSRDKSREIWSQKYPNVPYDIELKHSNPKLLDPDYQRKCAYDYVSAAQRQRSFNYNSSLPHFRDVKFLKKAVKRYKFMVMLKRDNPGTFIVPCYDNDLIWHTHQQFVTRYQEDTKGFLGKVFGHDDDPGDRAPGSNLEKSSNETKRLWKKNGKSFGVSGAMYRGEPSLPLVGTSKNRFKPLLNKQTNCYSFVVNRIVRTMIEANHLTDVLAGIKLMAASTLHQDSVPCQYFDHPLHTDFGMHAFTWRMVHCQKPALSAIEVQDINGNVVSTAHTIGSSSLPGRNQVKVISHVFTHKSSIERAILIRGIKGDWAILKSSWVGFQKGRYGYYGELGSLKMELHILNGKDSKWFPVMSMEKLTKFQYSTDQGKGWVDLKSGNITFQGSVIDVPEYVALGCAIAVSFVLCQPRPPPPYPPSNRPGVLDIDTMQFLIAGGICATRLPRWYHTKCHKGYFYQVHPYYLDDHGAEDEYSGYDYFHHGRGDWVNVCGSGDAGKCAGCGGRDYAQEAIDEEMIASSCG